MASIITIILFFVYIWGLGFTATYFLNKPENFLEKNFLRMGIGLGVFPILSILLNLLRIPLDWKIFLLLSISFPICILIKKVIKNKGEDFKFPQLKLTKSTFIMLVVIVIAAISFYMYTTGAFSYPYLENEDPWGHSVGVKYIALEKTAYDPVFEGFEKHIDLLLSYIDPYPPAYDIFMGVLHQTSSNLTWTLKFFNALIISLSFIFFYLFAKLFTRNRNKALFATLVFAAVPCYLTHFIWAHSLVIVIFFPALYAFWKIKDDKNWCIIATIILASIWVTQNLSQPIKLTIMILILITVASITYKKFLKWHWAGLVGGIMLSFLWFGDMIQKRTFGGFLAYYFGGYARGVYDASVETSSMSPTDNLNIIKKIIFFTQKILNPGGSGSRAYTFSDFFHAKGQNMINAPIGVGIVVSLLVIIGFIYILYKYRSSIVKKKNAWLCISVFWLIFAFWGINGITFPVSIARAAFRTWLLLAIPVALIAAEGLYFLKALLNSFFTSKRIRLIANTVLVVLVILGIFFTSAQQKYELNTVVWPTSGAFGGNTQEAFAYGAWFSTIPDDTKVFLYAPRDKLTIGFGKFSCLWCPEILGVRVNQYFLLSSGGNKLLNKSAVSLHKFLKRQDYEYFIINPRMDAKYFKNWLNNSENYQQIQFERYNEIQNSGLFTPVYQAENMFVVFKIN